MKALQPPPRTAVSFPERTRLLIESKKPEFPLPAMVAVVLAAGISAMVHPWAPFAVLAAAAGLAIVWKLPKGVYLLFLVLVPFSVEFAFGGGVKMDLPTEALIPVLFLVILLHGLRDGRIGIIRTPLVAPVLVFAAYFLVTLAVTRFSLVTLKAAARDWTHITGGFLLALLLIRSRRDTERLLRWGAVSTAALALYGIFTQLSQGVAIYQTIGAPFFHEHSIPAAFLSFLLVLSLGPVFSGYARSRWVRFGYVPLFALALALSFVRGAWIELAAGVLVIAWIYRKRIPLSFLAVTGLAVVILATSAAMLGITDLFRQRLDHFVDPNYVTNLDRIDRWGAGLSIWREHPLMGTGWGTYGDEYFDHVFIRRAFSSDQRMGAHNLYLEIMADGGIVGLVLFLSIIAVYYREAARVLAKVRGDPLSFGLCAGPIAAVSGHLVHAMVNNLGPSDKMAILFWFALALVPLAEHLWENRLQPDG